MSTDYAVASRFNVADQVVYVGPGCRNGDLGEVVRVTKGFDSIYRYDVRFSGRAFLRWNGTGQMLRLRIAITSSRITKVCLKTELSLTLPMVVRAISWNLCPQLQISTAG